MKLSLNSILEKPLAQFTPEDYNFLTEEFFESALNINYDLEVLIRSLNEPFLDKTLEFIDDICPYNESKFHPYLWHYNRTVQLGKTLPYVMKILSEEFSNKDMIYKELNENIKKHKRNLFASECISGLSGIVSAFSLIYLLSDSTWGDYKDYALFSLILSAPLSVFSGIFSAINYINVKSTEDEIDDFLTQKKDLEELISQANSLAINEVEVFGKIYTKLREYLKYDNEVRFSNMTRILPRNYFDPAFHFKYFSPNQFQDA